jgi:uncharacterized protein (TIGR03083 family)
MNDQNKIETLHLIPILDDMLITLLSSLSEDEWQAQTVAKLWKVKDVAAHLLDGNLRNISIARDGYFGEQADGIDSYDGLVSYLNTLNMSWTNAAKRLSPRVLITLLELSSKEYYDHLKTLDPDKNAIFSVAWAGQETSPNWFHIAREYTEKFLHQQQIRDAIGQQALMTRALFFPFIDTFMHAFPFAFRHIAADIDTVVALEITSEIGGVWQIIRNEDGWHLTTEHHHHAHSMVTMHPDAAWKLFSKSWSPAQVMDKVDIQGDRKLGEKVLNIVAVMA